VVVRVVVHRDLLERRFRDNVHGESDPADFESDKNW
jgi:hypothetical protein